MSVNIGTILGIVGQDPQITTFKDGNKIANFSVATTEYWKDKTSGEKKSKTEWHKVSIKNPNVVRIVSEYVKKGSKVYLCGKMETREWEDKTTGGKRSITEIVISGYSDKIEILDSKKPSQESQNTKDTKEDDFDPEDVPF